MPYWVLVEYIQPPRWQLWKTSWGWAVPSSVQHRCILFHCTCIKLSEKYQFMTTEYILQIKCFNHISLNTNKQLIKQSTDILLVNAKFNFGHRLVIKMSKLRLVSVHYLMQRFKSLFTKETNRMILSTKVSLVF